MKRALHVIYIYMSLRKCTHARTGERLCEREREGEGDRHFGYYLCVTAYLQQKGGEKEIAKVYARTRWRDIVCERTRGRERLTF